MDVRLVPNQSEHGKYNFISSWFDKIWKRFLCVQVLDTVCYLLLFLYLYIPVWCLGVYSYYACLLDYHFYHFYLSGNRGGDHNCGRRYCGKTWKIILSFSGLGKNAIVLDPPPKKIYFRLWLWYFIVHLSHARSSLKKKKQEKTLLALDPQRTILLPISRLRQRWLRVLCILQQSASF